MTLSPRASIVVPTYRRRDSVLRLLAALDRQTVGAETFEVVVSVDGSADGTLEAVEGYPAAYSLRALWQPNRGRAAACNAGIRAARGDLVILLDDDMEPTPEFVDRHLAAHAARDRRGVVGAAPVPLRPDSPPPVAYVGGRFNRHLAKLGRRPSAFGLRDFYSGNFSAPRCLLLEVGLFDEDFVLYGNEDLDLYWRLTEANVQVVYDPSARAWQHNTKSTRALAADRQAQGQTAVLLAEKRPAAASGLMLVCPREGRLLLRLGLRLQTALDRRTPRVLDALLHGVTCVERRLPFLLRGVGGRAVYGLLLEGYYWRGVRIARGKGRAESVGAA